MMRNYYERSEEVFEVIYNYAIKNMYNTFCQYCSFKIMLR